VINRRYYYRSRLAGKNHRGAALLMAMITVALIATFATAAVWRQWRGIEVESAERTRVQSSWLLTGALDWARILLQGDLVEDNKQSGSQTDHLGEPWAVTLAESRLSDFLSVGQASSSDLERNAFLSGQITDLQSRLNVLDLATSERTMQNNANIRFKRLFQALGLPGEEVDLMQRNLISALATMYPRQGGSSNSPVDQAPLLPQRVEQLTWVGISPGTLNLLTPYITVLPLTQPNSITPINLNTASSVVIYAAQPGLQLADAQRLVSFRQSQVFFKNVNDAMRSINVDATQLDMSWLSVNSRFFEVRGRLRLDNLSLEEVAAVQRTYPPSRVFPLWRARQTLTDRQEAVQ
jgi:general secretion pathway protein K